MEVCQSAGQSTERPIRDPVNDVVIEKQYM